MTCSVPLATPFLSCQKKDDSGATKIVLQNLKKLFCFALCALLLSACSKDGDQGPIGPQGAQGVKGETGPSGADGQDGEDGEQGTTGTANVIYSDWIPSGLGEEIITETSAFFNIQTSELTPEIKATGLIMVYGRYTSTVAFIHPLPKSIFGTRLQHYEFTINELNQNITIRVYSIDGTAVGIPLYDDFRYIIVPGGVVASKSNKDYTKMTYGEITAHFGIEE